MEVNAGKKSICDRFVTKEVVKAIKARPQGQDYRSMTINVSNEKFEDRLKWYDN